LATVPADPQQHDSTYTTGSGAAARAPVGGRQHHHATHDVEVDGSRRRSPRSMNTPPTAGMTNPGAVMSTHSASTASVEPVRSARTSRWRRRSDPSEQRDEDGDPEQARGAAASFSMR
jgi:hypothetical protein